MEECESARRAVEAGWADGEGPTVEEERALAEAKAGLERERLRPAHFRCFRRKPGEPSVLQEADMVCEADQVGLSLVLLSSEPGLPAGETRTGTGAVTVWPNDSGTYEVLVECRERRYVSELVKVAAVAELDKMDKRRPAPSECRKFVLQWKDHGREELFSEYFEEIEETVGQHILRFKKRKVARVQHTLELWQSQRIPYDKTNAEHEAKLLHLWELINPGEKLVARTSEQWKSLGFQGNDPATDFRGMGILGLNLLLFVAEHRPDDMRKILQNRQDYPFACGAINVAALMFEKLGFSRLANVDLSKLFHSSTEFNSRLMDFFCRVENDNVFEETFVCLLLLADARFAVTNATYMMFPKVMDWVKNVLEDLLSVNVSSVEQLRFLVEQRVLAMQMLRPDKNAPSPTASGRESRNDF